MHRLVVLTVIVLSIGCSSKSGDTTPVALRLEKFTTKPADSLLMGAYLLDSGSAAWLQHAYATPSKSKSKTVTLKIKKGKCKIENIPDAIADPGGEPIRGRLVTARGAWELKKDNDDWVMAFHFKNFIRQQDLKIEGAVHEFQGKAAITLWIGDRDDDKKLVFIKQ